MSVLAKTPQPGGIGLQQGGHLVDEGAGAAGANTVHALFQTAVKINDLGVFAAQFDGHIGLGSHLLQGRGYCNHFLYKGDAKGFAQIDRT